MLRIKRRACDPLDEQSLPGLIDLHFCDLLLPQMRSKCKWASAVLVAQPWYEDCCAQQPVGAHGASRQGDISMIQHSQEAQVTTDLGEEAPMHHNASYEDIGNRIRMQRQKDYLGGDSIGQITPNHARATYNRARATLLHTLMEGSDVRTQMDSRRSEKPTSARTGKCTEEFMQGPQSAPCTEFCTPRRWTGRAGAGGTRTANNKKKSIKEGDNNEDDDSEEDNDRKLDSNSELDSEDEYRDKGAAGDEGESKLFQSLSRIVNRYRQGKVQNQLSELQDLLTAGEQPDRKRSYRDVAAKGITSKQQTKVTKQQLTKQQPSNNSRQQPIRKEREWRKRRLNKAKWRDNEIMGYPALMESLEDGADPTGKVAVLTLEEAKNARELADLHMIIDKFWIVLDEQPSLEYTDRHMSICPKEQAEIHVVDLERAGPTRRWTIPLRLPAGQWPIPESRIEKVQETLEPVELTAIRVTVVREYTDPTIWKN